jgi:hypothetical protein
VEEPTLAGDGAAGEDGAPGFVLGGDEVSGFVEGVDEATADPSTPLRSGRDDNKKEMCERERKDLDEDVGPARSASRVDPIVALRCG